VPLGSIVSYVVDCDLEKKKKLTSWESHTYEVKVSARLQKTKLNMEVRGLLEGTRCNIDGNIVPTLYQAKEWSRGVLIETH
jgi:hypothetical protein